MRRRDGGAGRKVGARQWLLTPAAGARQFRASCWGGARGRDSQPRTRAASGLRLGILRSPARSWLTEPFGNCGLADVSRPKGRTESQIRKSRAGPKARPDAVRRTPQQGAERRPGGRSHRGSRAIPRSVRPRGGPRVRRSAPAPVGALLPRLRPLGFGGRAPAFAMRRRPP